MVINSFQKGDGKKVKPVSLNTVFKWNTYFQIHWALKLSSRKSPGLHISSVADFLLCPFYSQRALKVSSAPRVTIWWDLQGLGLGWHWWCDCSGVNWDCGHWPDLGRRWSLATKVANADSGFCSWPCVWCARWVSGLGAFLARLKRAAGCSRLAAAAPCSPVVMWGQAGSVLGRNWLTASGTDTVPLKWQSLVLCPFRGAQILKKKLSQRNTVELSPNVLGLSEQELVLPWNLIWSSAGAEDERQLMDYERSVISNVCYFIGGS